MERTEWEMSFVKELIRPNILSLKPYRCARDTVQEGILLDANENPFEFRYHGVLTNRYPDPHQVSLRAELSRFLGLSPEQVLAGNGSDEVLDWILKVFCSPGRDRLAITPPTYGMYQVIADIQGVEVFHFPLEADFSFDAECFLDQVPEDVRLLVLCSPNNPTGNLLSRKSILKVLEQWRGVVVVDEAYIEFAKTKSLAGRIAEFPNLIITRTFSKALGRAGLRLGYVLAAPGLIEYFRRVKMPYNLNALTLSEGIEALRNTELRDSQVSFITSERERVSCRLQEMNGIGKVYPSEANFILFECQQASAVYQDLFSKGIVIRDRSSVPGLESCLRVSIGTRDENQAFLGALEEFLKENV